MPPAPCLPHPLPPDGGVLPVPPLPAPADSTFKMPACSAVTIARATAVLPRRPPTAFTAGHASAALRRQQQQRRALVIGDGEDIITGMRCERSPLCFRVLSPPRC